MSTLMIAELSDNCSSYNAMQFFHHPTNTNGVLVDGTLPELDSWMGEGEFVRMITAPTFCALFTRSLPILTIQC